MERASEERDRPRRRGREERAPANSGPLEQPRRPFAPVKAVSDDQLEAIHETSLTILEEIGIDFLHDEAGRS